MTNLDECLWACWPPTRRFDWVDLLTSSPSRIGISPHLWIRCYHLVQRERGVVVQVWEYCNLRSKRKHNLHTKFINKRWAREQQPHGALFCSFLACPLLIIVISLITWGTVEWSDQNNEWNNFYIRLSKTHKPRYQKKLVDSSWLGEGEGRWDFAWYQSSSHQW